MRCVCHVPQGCSRSRAMDHSGPRAAIGTWQKKQRPNRAVEISRDALASPDGYVSRRDGKGAARRSLRYLLTLWAVLLPWNATAQVTSVTLQNPTLCTVGTCGVVGDGNCDSSNPSRFEIRSTNRTAGGTSFVLVLLDANNLILHRQTLVGGNVPGLFITTATTDQPPGVAVGPFKVAMTNDAACMTGTIGVGTCTPGAIPTNSPFTFDPNALDPSCAVPGGGAPPLSQQTRATSVAKSAAIGFGIVSVTRITHNVQTQIQSRFSIITPGTVYGTGGIITPGTVTGQGGIIQLAAGGQRVGLNGEGTQSTLSGGHQLALAYGQSIKPTSGTAWHSKGIFNTLQSKYAEKRQKKEQAAIDGLAVNGEATAEVTSPLAFKTPFDVWAAGSYTKFDGSRTGNSFDGDLFSGSTGVDYLVSPNFLIGGFTGYDQGGCRFYIPQ